MVAKKKTKRWGGINMVKITQEEMRICERMRISEKIGSGESLTTYERQLAVGYLRTLDSSTGPGSPGRKSGNTFAPEIALDYMIEKERLGKAAAARLSTANFWRVPESSVTDAFTDYKKYAEEMLADQLARFVGLKGQTIERLKLTEDMPMTRDHVLSNCIMLLRAWADIQPERKSQSGKLEAISPT